MRSLFSVILLPLLLSSQGTNRAIHTYDDSEAYRVYSAVLALEKDQGELLIADTTVFHTACLDQQSNKQFRSAVENYKAVNHDTWSLKAADFFLKRPYKLLSREEAGELLRTQRGTGAWPFGPAEGIHRFSAVGFDPEKRFAYLEMDVICGRGCGRGAPFSFEKKQGEWVQYLAQPIKSQDGTPILDRKCAWDY